MWLRNRQGTEPLSARSPLRARMALSWFALVVGVAVAVFFAFRAGATGDEVWVWEAAIAALVAVIAAVDLVVLHRRRSRGGDGQDQ
jgi:membrane protein YdbS with pleckstrin-like domain